jgi:hypothetical protein
MPISPNSLTSKVPRSPLLVAEDVVEQGGLAGAEEAGERGEGTSPTPTNLVTISILTHRQMVGGRCSDS